MLKSFQHSSDWTTMGRLKATRMWFNQVRKSASSIEGCRRELSALLDAREYVEPWSTGVGGSKSLYSDPTASAAQARMDGLERAIDDARAELDAHVELVGKALSVIEGVRSEVGERQADVLELYYIDCAQTWSDVAFELRLSRDTVRLARDAALAWVSEHVMLV